MSSSAPLRKRSPFCDPRQHQSKIAESVPADARGAGPTQEDLRSPSHRIGVSPFRSPTYTVLNVQDLALIRSLQPKLAIVLPDNSVAFAGGVFKFLAVHNLHCATGVFDELLLLQNASCRAHGRSIRA